ncbi:uncharacterized protein LOC34619813 [Cyclospora cayetanensis]|uniref:Uncharacterized protein LOC34619813 n=1 Tax=Cyclospora cayetanensis TaxID=88456 RepID=A0A6P6S399_9EIME|nr:uncharacterized protein LOC34619813 [Cyclospora cayetanensis]
MYCDSDVQSLQSTPHTIDTYGQGAVFWGGSPVAAQTAAAAALHRAASTAGRCPTESRGAASTAGRCPTESRGAASTAGRCPTESRGAASTAARCPTESRGAASTAAARCPTESRGAASTAAAAPRRLSTGGSEGTDAGVSHRGSIAALREAADSAVSQEDWQAEFDALRQSLDTFNKGEPPRESVYPIEDKGPAACAPWRTTLVIEAIDCGTGGCAVCLPVSAATALRRDAHSQTLRLLSGSKALPRFVSPPIVLPRRMRRLQFHLFRRTPCRQLLKQSTAWKDTGELLASRTVAIPEGPSCAVKCIFG